MSKLAYAAKLGGSALAGTAMAATLATGVASAQATTTGHDWHQGGTSGQHNTNWNGWNSNGSHDGDHDGDHNDGGHNWYRYGWLSGKWQQYFDWTAYCQWFESVYGYAPSASCPMPTYY